MATINEIRQNAQRSPEFRALMQEDTSRAENVLSEMLKEASDLPVEPGPIREFVRPVLEATGGMVGGLAGSPLGLAGAMGGGALGVAAGSSLSDILEQQFGEQEQFQTVSDALQRTNENLVLGVGSEAGGQIVGGAVRALGKALAPLAKRMTPDRQNLVDIAERMGIELSPAEITRSPTLIFTEKILSKVPFAAEEITAFDLKQLSGFVQQRNALLKRGGSPESLESLGKRIQDELDVVIKRNGVVREQAKRNAKNAILLKLGSRESLDDLGRSGQSAIRNFIQQKRANANGLFARAANLAGETNRVTTANIDDVVEKISRETAIVNPALMNRDVKAFLKQFRRGGNPELQQALAGIPRALSPKGKTQIVESLEAQFGKNGFKFRDILLLRNRLNDAIDAVDVPKQLNVPGAGKSGDATAKRFLVRLKVALDADVEAFAERNGGEVQALLQLGRLRSGEAKAVANQKTVQAFLRERPQDAIEALVHKASPEEMAVIRKAVGAKGFESIQRGLVNALFRTEETEKLSKSAIESRLNRVGFTAVEDVLGKGAFRLIQGVGEFFAKQDKVPVGNRFFRSLILSSPEKVAGTIIRSGGADKLRVIERSLGRKAVDRLREGFVSQVLRESETTGGPAVLPGDVAKRFRALDSNTLETLFRTDRAMLKELDDLSTLAEASIGAERRAGSTEGGALGLVGFMTGGLALSAPMKGVAFTLRAGSLAKLYNSPAGRKWLTTGFKLPQNSPELFTHIGRLGVVLGTQPLRPEPRRQPSATEQIPLKPGPIRFSQ